VLRIIEQRNDPEAVRQMLTSLRDCAPNVVNNVPGKEFIQNVLASRHIDPSQKQVLIKRLVALGVQVRCSAARNDNRLIFFLMFAARRRPRRVAAFATGTEKFSTKSRV
jgi:hypothetical protein